MKCVLATTHVRGIFVPFFTPFKADLSQDKEQFVKLCRWMRDNGATGLAPFGTTSEPNSVAANNKRRSLRRALASQTVLTR